MLLKSMKLFLAGVLNRCDWLQGLHPLQPQDVVAFSTSLCFVDSIWQIFGPLLAGHLLLFKAHSSLHCSKDGLNAIKASIPWMLSRAVRYQGKLLFWHCWKLMLLLAVAIPMMHVSSAWKLLLHLLLKMWSWSQQNMND